VWSASSWLLACSRLRRTLWLRRLRALSPPRGVAERNSIRLPLGAGEAMAGEAVSLLSRAEPASASTEATVARDDRRLRLPSPLAPATDEDEDIGGMRGVWRFGEKPGVANSVELPSVAPSLEERSGDR